MSAKSLLFSPDSPYSDPPGCAPGRIEVPIRVVQGKRIYTAVMRDKVAVEDPYLVLVKAAGFAIRQSEPYAGRVPARSVRDILIKSTVVI